VLSLGLCKQRLFLCLWLLFVCQSRSQWASIQLPQLAYPLVLSSFTFISVVQTLSTREYYRNLIIRHCYTSIIPTDGTVRIASSFIVKEHTSTSLRSSASLAPLYVPRFFSHTGSSIQSISHTSTGTSIHTPRPIPVPVSLNRAMTYR